MAWSMCCQLMGSSDSLGLHVEAVDRVAAEMSNMETSLGSDIDRCQLVVSQRRLSRTCCMAAWQVCMP